MRNIDRLGSPPISGAKCASRASSSSMSSRIGWRTSSSYSARRVSNPCLSLCVASCRKKRRAAGENGMVVSPRLVCGGRHGNRRGLDEPLERAQLVGEVLVQIGRNGGAKDGRHIVQRTLSRQGH